jgi:hypothetical protein
MRKDDIDGQCHHLLHFLWPHDDDDVDVECGEEVVDAVCTNKQDGGGVLLLLCFSFVVLFGGSKILFIPGESRVTTPSRV